MIQDDRTGRKPLLELVHPVGECGERARNDERTWGIEWLEGVRGGVWMRCLFGIQSRNDGTDLR